MTLNAIVAVILRCSTEFDMFGAICVKVVGFTLLAIKCSPKNLVFGNI